MTLLFTQVESEKHEWLAKGALLFVITEGKHKDKLVEVVATQVTKDLDNDNIADVVVVNVKARRVTEKGETVKVGTSSVVSNSGNHTIMTESIADGSIDPIEFLANLTNEVITKSLNIESAIGAFSFLPSMST